MLSSQLFTLFVAFCANLPMRVFPLHVAYLDVRRFQSMFDDGEPDSSYDTRNDVDCALDIRNWVKR